MDPKKKAESLISEFLSLQNEWFLKNLVDGLRISHAKKCAILAVNTAIIQLEKIDINGCQPNIEIEELEELIKEIEKL